MFKYIIISAVKNEEMNIEKTILAVISQTILPQEWIIVNDGSLDRTREIVLGYSQKYNWIKLLDRNDSKDYKLGARIVDNFYHGLEHTNSDYSFLVKLDGDLSFENDYFEYICNKFKENSRLGMASGQSYVPEKDGLFWEDTPEDHVKGLLSTYRKSCFEDIGGLIKSLGWDTVDEVTARMKGWETRSFKEKKIIHYRRLGSKMGILKGNIRHGYIGYIIGNHPCYVVIRCIYRAFEKPFIMASLAYSLGYFRAMIMRHKKVVSIEVETFYRKEQMRKIISKKFYSLYIEKVKKAISVLRIRKVIIFMLVYLFSSNCLWAAENLIEIECGSDITKKNKLLYGNNFIGYDPVTFERLTTPYYGYSDYGSGIWDLKSNEPVKEVISLAKDVGMAIIRFPGGCGTHHYNWKDAIGKNREHFLYGIDEFQKTCSDIGAESIITISYFTGNENDAADLVEYLNGTVDRLHKWAEEREKNGHRGPYNVKYFEIGNEDYHGDHRNIKKISPEEYANRYLKYYERMKRIDSSIKIGVVLWTNEWNRKVMEIVQDKVDFGIVHIYPTPEKGKKLSEIPAKDVFSISLALPEITYQRYIKNTLVLLEKYANKKVPLSITEYNCGFVQNKPVPYRHSLGSALLNAELLRIFMKPENNILMANYWQFCNSYWGMISNEFGGTHKTLHNSYFKRPNYYVFEMYYKYFGNMLLNADVQSGIYWFRGNKIPFISVNASKSADGNKVYLMVVNKNMDAPMTATIDLKDFVSAEEGNAWILNGPSVDATNEKNHDNVKVTRKRFKVPQPAAFNQKPVTRFEFTFEPHSLTAIEIERLK